MAYTLSEAAAATGKVKSTIFKACKNGRISYTKDSTGQLLIEPAELHRVFPPVSENAEISADKATEKTVSNAEFSGGNGLENRLLQQELRFLREKLADVERLKEDERRALSDRIEDLRGERGRLLRVIEEQAGSVKLLTDQRVMGGASMDQQGAGDRGAGGFFGRLFGRRG
ncbi:MAG: hypothetical protein M3Y22_10350 [Pseudomonadota bacterium]|nr:hypothetical protein [Pseudomonadota bacterium]